MSRPTSSEEASKLQQTVVGLEFELKTLTIERNQLKANLDFIANELNRMSKLTESLLTERNALMAQRSNLLTEVNSLTLERDSLNQQLKQVEAEEGLPIDLSAIVACFKSSLTNEQNAWVSNGMGFSIKNFSVDLRGIISKDGKLILPHGGRLAPERISTINLVMEPVAHLSTHKVEAAPFMMPNLTNFSLETGKRVMKSFGLELGEISQRPKSELPEGTIIEQDPSAGDEIQKGCMVNLVLTVAGNDRVPSVVNTTVEIGSARLSDDGWSFRVNPVNVAHPSPLLGRIVQQKPGSEEPVVKGDTLVELSVNLLRRAIEEIRLLGPETDQSLNNLGIQNLAELAFMPVADIKGVTPEKARELKSIGMLMVHIKDLDGKAAQLLVCGSGISSLRELADSDPEALYLKCKENAHVIQSDQGYFEREFSKNRLSAIISSAKTVLE